MRGAAGYSVGPVLRHWQPRLSSPRYKRPLNIVGRQPEPSTIPIAAVSILMHNCWGCLILPGWHEA